MEHIFESIATALIVAFVSYGAMKNEVRNLSRRMDVNDTDRRSMSERIDRIIERIKA